MKKRVPHAAVVAALIGLTACSYRVEFVIANKGDAAFTAMYKAYDPHWKEAGCPPLDNVAPKQFEWNKRRNAEHVPFSDAAVYYAPNCTISVRIEPGMAASLGNWSPTLADFSKLGPVRLKSPLGWVEYSGSELLARAKRKSNTLWVLIHKPAMVNDRGHR